MNPGDLVEVRSTNRDKRTGTGLFNVPFSSEADVDGPESQLVGTIYGGEVALLTAVVRGFALLLVNGKLGWTWLGHLVPSC